MLWVIGEGEKWGRHVLEIIVCYIIGLIAGSFIWAIYFGQALLGFALAFGGAILGLPTLLVTEAIFIGFNKSILRYLSLWCLGAPFIVVVLWVTLEWEILYSWRVRDIYWYLSLRDVWERGTLAFTCASISSTLFWYWNRSHAWPAPPHRVV